jgi:PKHD-type hydroxylase
VTTYLTLPSLITAETLAKIREILEKSKFIDGRITADKKTEKNNLEMSPDEQYVEVARIVDVAVRASEEIRYAIFPRYMSRPIVSRYDPGMSFSEHTDSAIMGLTSVPGRTLSPYGQNFVRTDFSMTLFLSDADSYDGGELQIQIDGEPRRFKMPAGGAVVYETGVRHRVMPVTRGVRLAAVVWMQTMVRNSDHRQLLRDSYRLTTRLQAQDPLSAEAQEANDLFHNLTRTFAAV